MATTVRYRIRSGEVLKISPKGQTFDDVLDPGQAVLTDPPITDGGRASDDDGRLRVLGYAKIWDGAAIRNATQAEIDTFGPAEDEDQKDLDADDARALLETKPVFRRAFRAMSELLRDEINAVRAQVGMPPRSQGQVRAALRSRVRRDD